MRSGWGGFLVSVCYQLSNQSYEKYADEIKSKLNRLKEHIQLNNQDVHTINIKNTFYENVAENTFINGIKEPYHSYYTLIQTTLKHV